MKGPTSKVAVVKVNGNEVVVPVPSTTIKVDVEDVAAGLRAMVSSTYAMGLDDTAILVQSALDQVVSGEIAPQSIEIVKS